MDNAHLGVHFNSHAHVERDEIKERASSKAEISTHTLTWSVTSAASVIACAGKYFNSHAHVERDQSGIELAFAKDISTHTLTWSVTCLSSITKFSQIFQLTRSRGA